MRKNGRQITTAGGTLTAGTTPPLNLNLFNRAGGLLKVAGVFGEMIIINSPSTDDMIKLEGYLAWKWGLQDKLPGDHLFKSNPPKR